MANDNGFSLESISQLRTSAFFGIRSRSAQIAMIARSLEGLDLVLAQAVATGSVDDRQSLIDAARQLSDILNGRPAKPFDHAAASRGERAATKRRFAGRELPVVPMTGGVPW